MKAGHREYGENPTTVFESKVGGTPQKGEREFSSRFPQPSIFFGGPISTARGKIILVRQEGEIS